MTIARKNYCERTGALQRFVEGLRVFCELVVGGGVFGRAPFGSVVNDAGFEEQLDERSVCGRGGRGFSFHQRQWYRFLRRSLESSFMSVALPNDDAFLWR